MKKKILFFLMIVSLSFISCKSITHQTEIKKSLPSLGHLGIFQKYIAQEIINEKAIITINTPLRIKVESIRESKRELFTGKDSVNPTKKYLSLEILDKFSLLEQISQNEELLGYLKSNANVRVISKVFIEFSETVTQEILKAQEYYLVQHKEKTLSIELRNENKTTRIIEFSEGIIVDYESSEFCWGTKKGYKVELIDLVEEGHRCNTEAYKSYKKAKRKSEFSF